MPSSSPKSDVEFLAGHLGMPQLPYFDAQLSERMQLALGRWPVLRVLDERFNPGALAQTGPVAQPHALETGDCVS